MSFLLALPIDNRVCYLEHLPIMFPCVCLRVLRGVGRVAGNSQLLLRICNWEIVTLGPGSFAMSDSESQMYPYWSLFFQKDVCHIQSPDVIPVCTMPYMSIIKYDFILCPWGERKIMRTYKTEILLSNL